MKYEIKDRWSGKVLYQDEAESFRALVVAKASKADHLKALKERVAKKEAA